MSKKLHVDGSILPFPQTPSASFARRTLAESRANPDKWLEHVSDKQYRIGD